MTKRVMKEVAKFAGLGILAAVLVLAGVLSYWPGAMVAKAADTEITSYEFTINLDKVSELTNITVGDTISGSKHTGLTDGFITIDSVNDGETSVDVIIRAAYGWAVYEESDEVWRGCSSEEKFEEGKKYAFSFDILCDDGECAFASSTPIVNGTRGFTASRVINSQDVQSFILELGTIEDIQNALKGTSTSTNIEAANACNHEFQLDYSATSDSEDTQVWSRCIHCGEVKEHYTIPNSAYYNWNVNVVGKIQKASQGATVTIDTDRWNTFHEMVLTALENRQDVTLVVKYTVSGGAENGQRKQLEIPAISVTDAQQTAKRQEISNRFQNKFCGFANLADYQVEYIYGKK